MAYPFYTIGHSTHPIEEFVALLREAQVTSQVTSQVRCLVDVRTVPRSRTNPQYNREALPQTLAPFGIGYEHIAALGGLRGRKRDVPDSVNAFWQNASFHNYADYAMGDDFHAALARLRELGHAQPCAIMCAEAVWWRCHRRIVADYLLAAGEDVRHIMEHGRTEPATLTPGAAPQSDGTILYPAAQGLLI
jgi:uncharacterized protein (DUF488 family)